MIDLKEIESRLNILFLNFNSKNQPIRIEFAYLFGSNVKGNISPSSDIDIAVFFNQLPSLDQELSLFSEISKFLKSNNIDLVILNRAKNLFLLENIVKEGIPIFDTNREKRILFEAKVIHQAIDFKTHRKILLGK